ncbi:hypothetical protein U3A55_12080 [Salarchaeum sp. III]|uniref:hypothetical protein n=1 Tax=Salarchaeum sp. III TaxID=3107927 RepID=UPI002ED8C1E2
MTDRFYNASIASAGHTNAGVGDQTTSCQHGTPGCPGPNSSTGLPCAKCFLSGDTDE